VVSGRDAPGQQPAAYHAAVLSATLTPQMLARSRRIPRSGPIGQVQASDASSVAAVCSRRHRTATFRADPGPSWPIASLGGKPRDADGTRETQDDESRRVRGNNPPHATQRYCRPRWRPQMLARSRRIPRSGAIGQVHASDARSVPAVCSRWHRTATFRADPGPSWPIASLGGKPRDADGTRETQDDESRRVRGNNPPHTTQRYCRPRWRPQMLARSRRIPRSGPIGQVQASDASSVAAVCSRRHRTATFRADPGRSGAKLADSVTGR